MLSAASLPDAAQERLPRPATLALRARLKRAMRAFFDAAGFIEVDTPSRIAAPAPEEFIDCIPAAGKFLRPSPELEMKRLLGAGCEKIYQFGPCFRADERGWKHREEFTMLEYYAAHRDYVWLRDLTTRLIADAVISATGSAKLTFRGEKLDLAAEPEIITVEEAFRRYAGCSCAEADASDSFDELMVTKIEPQLGRGRLTYLCDYPVSRASLARRKPSDERFAERWELYLAGVELANAYGELTDGEEQTRRFRAAADFRAKRGAAPYPEAEAFLAMLRRGDFPASTGNALGFDRLVLIAADAADLGEVFWP